MEIARYMRDAVKNQLKQCHDDAQNYLRSLSPPKLALVIDGKCLMYALDPSLRVMLLNLSLNCTSVVCCRVSPLQKAQVSFLIVLLLIYVIIFVFLTLKGAFYFTIPLL